MRILNTVLAATALTLSLASTVPEASARGWYHHSHWSHHYRHWGFRSHVGYRWGHRWGYRHYGVSRVCPPGSHLGYLGRYCHPNRS